MPTILQRNEASSGSLLCDMLQPSSRSAQSLPSLSVCSSPPVECGYLLLQSCWAVPVPFPLLIFTVLSPSPLTCHLPLCPNLNIFKNPPLLLSLPSYSTFLSLSFSFYSLALFTISLVSPSLLFFFSFPSQNNCSFSSLTSLSHSFCAFRSSLCHCLLYRWNHLIFSSIPYFIT